MTIQEIQEISEKILNHWALTDTKQLGLQICTEAIRLASENERLKIDLREANFCSQCRLFKVGRCDGIHRRGKCDDWKWRGLEPTP